MHKLITMIIIIEKKKGYLKDYNKVEIDYKIKTKPKKKMKGPRI